MKQLTILTQVPLVKVNTIHAEWKSPSAHNRRVPGPLVKRAVLEVLLNVPCRY